MLFSSTIFLFGFLPAVLAGYFLLGRKYRNIFLLLASLLFYAWGEPTFVLMMLFSILINWVFGLFLEHYKDRQKICKTIIIIMLFSNLSILFIFKYLNFTISNLNLIFSNQIPQTDIKLPIGISFFTFQSISYVIDVYRGHAKVQKNILNLALYISFFPQLIAGPIVRYQSIEEQITERSCSFDMFSSGIARFIIGLSKKVLLSNTLAIVADKAFTTADLSIAFSWLGALSYAFQILFDFSGYSDMAIGLGLMFGFHFNENFNFPYCSASISEFWRRWHISLGSWFRDYVYFPLGGSRVKSRKKLIFNLFVVWLLTGVWHGASWNFVVWGLLYFILICFEKLFSIPQNLTSPASRIFYRCFTLFCILLGWVVFRAPNLPHAFQYIQSMFGISKNVWIDGNFLFRLHENAVFLISAFFASIPTSRFISTNLQKRKIGRTIYAIFYPIVLLLLLLTSTSYLIIGSYNPFIYFNF